MGEKQETHWTVFIVNLLYLNYTLDLRPQGMLRKRLRQAALIK